MKDEFISTVSHELRTPLTAIYGSLDLLNAGMAGELPAEARQLLAISHESTRAADPPDQRHAGPGEDRLRQDGSTACSSSRCCRWWSRRSATPAAYAEGLRRALRAARRRRSRCVDVPTPTASCRSASTCCRTPPSSRRPAARWTCGWAWRTARRGWRWRTAGAGVPPEFQRPHVRALRAGRLLGPPQQGRHRAGPGHLPQHRARRTAAGWLSPASRACARSSSSSCRCRRADQKVVR